MNVIKQNRFAQKKNAVFFNERNVNFVWKQKGIQLAKHAKYNNRQRKKYHLNPYTAYALHIELVPKDDKVYEASLDDILDKIIDFAEANDAYVTGFGSLDYSENDSSVKCVSGYIDPYINDSIRSRQRCLELWATFPAELKAYFKECKIDIVDSYYSDK